MKIQTRIQLKSPRKTTEIRYAVEYMKSKKQGWKNYATVDTVAEAEWLRQKCRELNGGYPVLHEFKGKRFQRYRIVEDWKYGSKSYNIEYKYLLQGWHYAYNCFKTLEEAIQHAAKISGTVTHFSRYGLVRGLQSIGHTFSSIVLCIQYPFLYPRNRFTGKHYNNWKLDDRIDKIFEESHVCTNPVEFHHGMTEEELHEMQNPKYRVTNFWKAMWCRVLKIYRGFLTVIHSVPTHTEMDAMEHGWRKAFGNDLLKELKQILKKNHYLRQYRIMQIKEKWGELCWYDAAAPREVFDMLRKYENLSYRTCICCGRPAKYRTRGYILPYCESCMPQKDLDYGSYTVIHENETGWVEVDPDEILEKIENEEKTSVES